jgi:hypothetical protein
MSPIGVEPRLRRCSVHGISGPVSVTTSSRSRASASSPSSAGAGGAVSAAAVSGGLGARDGGASGAAKARLETDVPEISIERRAKEASRLDMAP